MSSTPPSPSSRTVSWRKAVRRRGPRRRLVLLVGGNRPGTMAYDSQFRLVLNGPEAAAGTQRQASQGARPFYAGDPQLCGQPAARRTSRRRSPVEERSRSNGNEPYDPTPPALAPSSLKGSGRDHSAAANAKLPTSPARAGQIVAITADADATSPTPTRRRYHLAARPQPRGSRVSKIPPPTRGPRLQARPSAAHTPFA